MAKFPAGEGFMAGFLKMVSAGPDDSKNSVFRIGYKRA